MVRQKDDLSKMESLEIFSADMESALFLLDNAGTAFSNFLKWSNNNDINLNENEKKYLTDWLAEYQLMKTRFYKRLYNTTIN